MIASINAWQAQNLNLKYCERCGGLWLRRTGSKQSICNPCAEVETAIARNGSGSFLYLWSRLRAEAQT